MAIDPFIEQSNEQIDLKALVDTAERVKSAENLYNTQDIEKLIKGYLEESIPEEIRNTKLFKEFWAVLGRNIQLTFLDKIDLEVFEILFDQCRLTFLMHKPAYEYTFIDLQALEQLKIYFSSALRRAQGVAGHRFNERIILGGQISQIISSKTDGQRTHQATGGGALSRFWNGL